MRRGKNGHKNSSIMLIMLKNGISSHWMVCCIETRRFFHRYMNFTTTPLNFVMSTVVRCIERLHSKWLCLWFGCVCVCIVFVANRMVAKCQTLSDNTKGKCIFAASSFSVLGLFFHFYLELCSEQTNIECVNKYCVYFSLAKQNIVNFVTI